MWVTRPVDTATLVSEFAGRRATSGVMCNETCDETVVGRDMYEYVSLYPYGYIVVRPLDPGQTDRQTTDGRTWRNYISSVFTL